MHTTASTEGRDVTATTSFWPFRRDKGTYISSSLNKNGSRLALLALQSLEKRRPRRVDPIPYSFPNFDSRARTPPMSV